MEEATSDDAIAKFINGISRGPFYIKGITDTGEDVLGLDSGSFLQDNNNKECEDIYPLAVHQAYLDLNRTLSDVGDSVKSKKNIVTDKLREYFKGAPPNTPSCFDEHHNEMMAALIYDERQPQFSVGQAQKLINMAFKYLYCCEDFRDKKKDHFNFCHMPLDSFTLNWTEHILQNSEGIPEKLGSSAKRLSKVAWSSISDQGGYEELMNEIRKFLGQSAPSITILEAEFEIWEIEKKRAAATDAKKLLNNTLYLHDFDSELDEFIEASYFGEQKQSR